MFLSRSVMPRTSALMARSFRDGGSLALRCCARTANHMLECSFIAMITHSSRCVKSGNEMGIHYRLGVHRSEPWCSVSHPLLKVLHLFLIICYSCSSLSFSLCFSPFSCINLILYRREMSCVNGRYHTSVWHAILYIRHVQTVYALWEYRG